MGGRGDLYQKSQMEMSFREVTAVVSERRATAKRFKPEREAESREELLREKRRRPRRQREEGMNIFIQS